MPFRTIVLNVKDSLEKETEIEGDSRNERRFSAIYIKFESIKDCAFNIEVTFPKEEDFIKRR